MTATVSFILPVLNESALVAQRLEQLRARFAAAELIVVDGGSSDETVRRALPLCDQLLIGERGRAAQMNLGARAARGDYLFFLHADSMPAMNSVELNALLAQAPAWGFCSLQLSGQDSALRVVEWFINRRSRLTSVSTGDQMQFVEAGLFYACGGFEDIPLMEDVALSKRLRTVARPVMAAQPVVTSSRRWEEGGVVRTVLRMWCLRLAYFLGVHPDRLWRYYYGG